MTGVSLSLRYFLSSFLLFFFFFFFSYSLFLSLFLFSLFSFLFSFILYLILQDPSKASLSTQNHRSPSPLSEPPTIITTPAPRSGTTGPAIEINGTGFGTNGSDSDPFGFAVPPQLEAWAKAFEQKLAAQDKAISSIKRSIENKVYSLLFPAFLFVSNNICVERNVVRGVPHAARETGGGLQAYARAAIGSLQSHSIRIEPGMYLASSFGSLHFINLFILFYSFIYLFILFNIDAG